MAAGSGLLISTTLRRPRLRYHLLAPEGCTHRRPIVFVHGVSSDPVRQFHALTPLALRCGVPLLVPEFARPEFRGFQQLAGRGGTLEAADAFNDMLGAAEEFLAVPFQSIDLVGFSGGAQFAHRYALLFPHKVNRIVVAAAGWFTLLDPSRRFPYGIDLRDVGHKSAVHLDSFLSLSLRVMVGDADTRRDSRLRTTARMDREQGVHRLERAGRWVEHLHAVARSRGVPADFTLELLPETSHSFEEAVSSGGMIQRVARHLGLVPGQTAPAPLSLVQQ